jgi:hypothetical protein
MVNSPFLLDIVILPDGPFPKYPLLKLETRPSVHTKIAGDSSHPIPAKWPKYRITIIKPPKPSLICFNMV